MKLEEKIRDIPDFPKKGIIFKDITTLLKDADAFRWVIDGLAAEFSGGEIDMVVAIESRGFILGGAVAHRLGLGFVPVRKLGKLPAETIQASYDLEYGSNTVEMHRDAIKPGQRVLVVDDLLATGGTVEATVRLIEDLGGEIAGVAFLIELDFLHGRDKLSGYRVVSLVHY